MGSQTDAPVNVASSTRDPTRSRDSAREFEMISATTVFAQVDDLDPLPKPSPCEGEGISRRETTSRKATSCFLSSPRLDENDSANSEFARDNVPSAPTHRDF